MWIKPIIKLISSIYLLISIVSCNTAPLQEADLEVHTDTLFRQLFSPDSGGITGADGIFSIPLPDGSSVILTGDCFLGVVKDGARDLSTKMMNNAMILISPDLKEARAIYRGSWENPETLMVPEQEGHWYWPGHGFYRDSTLYVFALNMIFIPHAVVKSEKDTSEMDRADEMEENMWAFDVAGIDLMRFSYPGLEFLSLEQVMPAYESSIHFGNNVLDEGNYLYFFGTRNDPVKAQVYAARTRKDNPPYHLDWEFHNGDTWVKDHHQAAPMDIDIPVSEQFSIFRMKNKYVLLTHEKMTSDIYTYTSDVPYKGFSNKTFIYTSPEPDSSNNLFAYNALAHPQYMKGDRLLVSYCVNSHQVRDVFTDVESYRARFIRVPLEKIDPSFAGYRPEFKLAMVQMKVEGGQRETNLNKAARKIAEAAGEGADIVLLPELMDLGWAHPSILTEATMIPGGESCNMLVRAARENGVWVCAGLAEKSAEKTYNSALLISPSGDIKIHHRKINILDIAQDYYGQGKNLDVVETPFGNVGLLICADAFAEQDVMLQTLCYMEADLILSPTSWALPPKLKHDSALATDEWVGHYAPAADAYDVYIAGCSNVGKITDGPWKGFSAIGNSLLIGPHGQILAGNRFGEDAETIIYKNINIQHRPVRGTDWQKYLNL